MRTGEIATSAGVNVQTLRFYERRGLLKAPARRSSGYREYPAEAAQIVRFIKRAQELGFTLDEVHDLLRLRDNRSTSCAKTRTIASTKIKAIDDKIRQLRAMKQALATLVETCGDQASRSCPIIEALDSVAARKDRRPS